MTTQECSPDCWEIGKLESVAKMAFKKGDRVRFKTGGDQWAYMKEMKIQTVNNDGTYDVIGRNPHLKQTYGTIYCCTLRVKEHNLERGEDGRE